jgi:metal-responsive CopG/Arc/MetJ family transcriptional regulator
MSTVTRTTIRLDEQLLRDAKKLAAETGRTLTAVIEDALRETLARRASPPHDKHWEFPTFNMGGLMPGVDLDNSAALLDLMEADDDPV